MANPRDQSLASKASVRNNNPGALDYEPSNTWVGRSGRDGRFDQFQDEVYGFRAQTMTLMKYTSEHNISTLSEITSRYAPSFENNTGAYIDTLARELGISKNDSVLIPGTKFIRPDVLTRLVQDKARYEMEWPKPLDAAWDPAKYQIGVAMAMARRGVQYLDQANKTGDATAKAAAMQILEEAKKLDPYAVETELARGDRPISKEEISQEVQKLSQNYKDGKIKADAVQYAAKVDPLTVGRDAADKRRQETATDVSREAFRTVGKSFETLNPKDPAQLAKFNDYYNRLSAYAKKKNDELPEGERDSALNLTPKKLEADATPEQTKEMLGAITQATQKLAEKNKVDADAPLPDGTVGDIVKRHTEDTARRTAERSEEDGRRKTQQDVNDYNGGGQFNEDMFFLGLLLMAFGRGDLAQMLFNKMGSGSGQGGHTPARDYRPFNRNGTDRLGNVPTSTPGVKPEPKLFNFVDSKTGQPLLQLPIVTENATLKRDGDVDRFTVTTPSKVVAPANAKITEASANSLTIEWQESGKNYKATLSGINKINGDLKVGQIINRGDELGSSNTAIDLQVSQDGKVIEPRFSGLNRSAATLQYSPSKKRYDELEAEQNAKLEHSYGRGNKTNIITSGIDERHRPFDGNSGVANAQGSLSGGTRSNDDVRRLPLFDMPDAVKEAAAKSPNGWAQVHVTDAWDQTRYVGRYVFYHKDAGQYLNDVGAGKKFQNADQAMKAAMAAGLVEVHATSGGGRGPEDKINGRTPYTVREDAHPDPDVLAVSKTGTVRALIKYPSIRGEELFPPRIEGGDSRDGFMTHRETRGGEIGSSGCVTVDWESYRSAKEKKGMRGNDIIFLHPNVATKGPTQYKEIDPEFRAVAAERGVRVTNQVVAGKVIIPNPSAITYNKASPYWASLDSQGRLIGGNNPLSPSDPASTMKMGTLYVIAKGLADGRNPSRPNDALSGVNVPPTFMNQQVSFEGRSWTIAEALPYVMAKSSNEGARAVAAAFAKSSRLVTPDADTATALIAFNKHSTDVFKSIGMNGTIMGDPAGHPNAADNSPSWGSGTVSTAYDLAVLSRRMVLDHPEVAKYAMAEDSRTGASDLTQYGMDIAKTGTGGGGLGGSREGAKSLVGASRSGVSFGLTHADRGNWKWIAGQAAKAANAGRNAAPLTDAERGIAAPVAAPTIIPQPVPKIQPDTNGGMIITEEGMKRAEAAEQERLKKGRRDGTIIAAPAGVESTVIFPDAAKQKAEKPLQRVRVFDAGHGPVPDIKHNDGDHDHGHMNAGGGSSNEITEYQANLLQMLADGVESMKRGVQPVYTNVAPDVMAKMIKEGKALPPGITEADLRADPRTKTFKNTMAKIENAMQWSITNLPPDRFDWRLNRATALRDGKYPGLEGTKFDVSIFVSNHHDTSNKTTDKGLAVAVHKSVDEQTIVAGRAIAETMLTPGNGEVPSTTGDDYFKTFAKNMTPERRTLFGSTLKAHNTSAIQPTPYEAPGDKREHWTVTQGLGDIPGVLIEHGFASNAEDRTKIASPETRAARAKRKIDGIERFEKLRDQGVSTVRQYEDSLLKKQGAVTMPDTIQQKLATLDLTWMGIIAQQSDEKRRAEATEKGADSIDGALAKVASLSTAKGKVEGGGEAKTAPESAPVVPNVQTAENKSEKKTGASATA